MKKNKREFFENPVAIGGDPFVMRYNGRYYLYCSTGNNQPIYVRKSKDLVNWSEFIECADKEEVPSGTNEHGGVCETSLPAYAPEVTYYNGKFYMVTSLGGTGHHSFVADSPEGPFKLMTGNWGNKIDGSIFIDNKGTWYFYRANWGDILAYEMESPIMPSSDTIETGCTITTSDDSGRWTEGPHVIYHDGVYFHTYTGNHVRNPAYRIYYSTSREDASRFTPADDNPLLISTTKAISGIGHSSSVKAPDLDSYYIVYHSRQINMQRAVNIGRIVISGEKMRVLGPTTEKTEKPFFPEICAFFEDEKDLLLFDKEGSIGDCGLEIGEGEKLLSLEKISDNSLTLEVTFTRIGSRAGIIFGYKNEENFGKALFDAESESLKVVFVNGGKITEYERKLVRSFDIPYDFSVLQAMQIEKSGDTFTFYVNDRELFKVTNALDVSGKVGIVAEEKSACVGYFGATANVGGSSVSEYAIPITSQTGYIQACYAIGGTTLTTDKKTLEKAALVLDSDELSYNILVEKTGLHNLSVYSKCDADALVSILVDKVKIASGRIASSEGYSTSVIKALELTEGEHEITLAFSGRRAEIKYFELIRTEDEISAEGEPSYSDGVCFEKNEDGLRVNGWGKRLYGSHNSYDYEITADITLDKGDVGILARVTSAAETNLIKGMNPDGSPITLTDGESARKGRWWFKGYLVSFGNGKVSLYKNNYGEKLLLERELEPSEKGIKISLSCKGDTLTLTVNKENIFEYKDAEPYLYGMAGIRGADAGALIKNLTVGKI